MLRSRTSSRGLQNAILLFSLLIFGEACAHVDVVQQEVLLRVGHESGDFVKVFSEVVIFRDGSFVSTLRSGKRRRGRLSPPELSLVSSVLPSPNIPCRTSRPPYNLTTELVWVDRPMQGAPCYYVPGFLTPEMSNYLQQLHTVLTQVLGSRYDVPLLGEEQLRPSGRCPANTTLTRTSKGTC
jgi:hypothetical protein